MSLPARWTSLTVISFAGAAVLTAPRPSWFPTAPAAGIFETSLGPRDATPAGSWTVERELSIGSADGGEAYVFGRIVDVDVGPEGELYILDQQAAEVRVFGPDGRWLRSLGRPGAGPGELGGMATAVVCVDDEVWVPDLQNRRIVRYSASGGVLGSPRLDLARGVPIRWDGPLDGRLIAQLRAGGMAATATGISTGDALVMFGPEGATGDTLLVLPPGESLTVGRVATRFHFFEPEPLWDLGEDGQVTWARNSEGRFVVVGRRGRVLRTIVHDMERLPVTDRDRALLEDAVRASMIDQGAPPEAVHALLAGSTFAQRYPAFANLFAGPAGSVWAQRVVTAGELDRQGIEVDLQRIGSSEWDVFDAEGRHVGVVQFPRRFHPLEVRGDRILGVGLGDLGIQSLDVYRVVR